MAAGLIDAPVAETPDAPAPAVRTGPNRAVVVGTALTTAALLALAFVAYALFLSGVQASRAQDLRYDAFRADLKAGVLPVDGGSSPGTSVALLRIPRLDVTQVVVEGTSSEQTADAPGHRRDSVLPGQAGTAVLLGRSTTGGRPFARLSGLAVGDEIEVTTGQGRFVFVVDLVRRSDDRSVPVPAATSRLQLVGSERGLRPDREVEVYAALRGTATPTGLRTPISADELPGRGSRDAAVPLAAWSLLLLAGALGLVWARRRAPLVVLAVGGAPVLLAVVWHVFENLLALLPNTL